MKVVRSDDGKKGIKISMKEWEHIGEKAGWLKTSQSDETTRKPDPLSVIDDAKEIKVEGPKSNPIVDDARELGKQRKEHNDNQTVAKQMEQWKSFLEPLAQEIVQKVGTATYNAYIVHNTSQSADEAIKSLITATLKALEEKLAQVVESKLVKFSSIRMRRAAVLYVLKAMIHSKIPGGQMRDIMRGRIQYIINDPSNMDKYFQS